MSTRNASSLMVVRQVLERVSSVFYLLTSLFLGKKVEIEGIKIKGSEEFCQSIKEALYLLKEKDPESFSIVKQHVDLFAESSRRAFGYFPGTLIAIALDKKKIISFSITWLASLLVYYARFAQVKYKQKNKEKTFLLRSAGDYMYTCLKRIGGSYEELEQVADFLEDTNQSS